MELASAQGDTGRGIWLDSELQWGVHEAPHEGWQGLPALRASSRPCSFAAVVLDAAR